MSAGRHAGLLLALLVSTAAVLYQRERPHPGYTRHDLPTFDGYVYMTMADEPAFFTAAPWGYRILEPWLVHLFPPRARLLAFRDISTLALIGGGALFFLFLRRLGHRQAFAVAGAAAFLLSAPVRLSLHQPMLGEALAVSLEVAALLAIASGALPVFAAVLALGALVKDVFLLMPPLAVLAVWPRAGLARALRVAAASAGPAVASVVLLRLWWTPGLRTPHAPWNHDLVRAGLLVLARDFEETWRPLLLAGLLPLAALGALLPESRGYLKLYGYFAALMLVVSLIAWINVPSPVPVPLFGANTARLLVYAVPVLVPLALVPFERALRLPAVPTAAGAGAGTATGIVALVVCGACVVSPLVLSDRYRRLPLHESRDGPLLMAFCRESLRMARRVERGEEVALDPARHRYTWGEYDPGQLFDMRWYLRAGWGRLPHYGTGDVLMQGPSAELVLPCVRPRELRVTLFLESARRVTLATFVNGRPLGRVNAGPEAFANTVTVPAAALFRGDNLLKLIADAEPASSIRLADYRVRAAP